MPKEKKNTSPEALLEHKCCVTQASAVSFLDFAVVWRANWVNKGFSREKTVTSSPLVKPCNCEQNTGKQINNAQIEISEETV